MANESISPVDNSPIEVLLAGNLAADDLLWVVRCPATELQSLLLAPVAWVAALARLPGWLSFGTASPMPAPALAADFVLQVVVSAATASLGGIVVQGISGTNALTLTLRRADAPAIARSLGLADAGASPFQPFWDDVSSDPGNPPSLKKRLPIDVVVPIGRWFSHFEILDRGEDPAARAARAATFLLAAALDPAGYGEMLSGLDQEVLLTVPGEPAAASPPLRLTVADSASLSYGNVEGPEDDDPDPDPSPIPSPDPAPATCGVESGDWTPDTELVVDGTVVKRYGGGGG